MAAEEIDRIAEVFRDQNVFISGATGFLGKVLVEKLLRCTEVKCLYLLIRNKRDQPPSERLKSILNHVLFEKLKKEKPDVFKKCILIAGDVTEENLGISPAHQDLLHENVNLIFHSAATTRFDDTLKYAVRMNTRGTLFMLDLAKRCKKLKLFVHVSTAYAFPKEKVLYEKPYEPPADPHEVLNSINWINEETLSNVTKDLLGDIPNTYTFSKALAEALVNEQVGKLPVIITRPAVVIPIWKDPLPGYFNNLQGPMGIFVGGGKGVIRSVLMDSKSHANLVPADSTVHAIIVACWDYLSTRKQHVFNICVPEDDFKMNWEDILDVGKEVISTKVPFNGILWYPGGEITKCRTWHYVNFALFQMVPALFIDFILMVLGYKPVLYNIQMRIHKGQEMFDYYTTKAWNFNTDYFLGLRRKLNKKEKQTYIIFAEGVDIRDYLTNSILYARRHILKETDDMLPAAKRNMKIMFVLDRIVKITFFLVAVYVINKFILTPCFRFTMAS